MVTAGVQDEDVGSGYRGSRLVEMNGKGLALRNVTSTRRPHPRFPLKDANHHTMKTIFSRREKKNDILKIRAKPAVVWVVGLPLKRN